MERQAQTDRLIKRDYFSGLEHIYVDLGNWQYGNVSTSFVQCLISVVYTGTFSGRGYSTNSVEDRGKREQGSGGSSPLVRGSTQLEMSETSIMIRLLQMHFTWN
jgi:hypothetical protein